MDELLVLEVGVWSICKAIKVTVFGSFWTVEVSKTVDLVECMSEPAVYLIESSVKIILLITEEALELDCKRIDSIVQIILPFDFILIISLFVGCNI